jgi:sRNA-binding regulator protein Hfq
VPKSKAPAQTFEEANYLKALCQDATPVSIKLVSGETVHGVIEYWDADFVRLTRVGSPNLFIYKHEIRYMSEQPPRKSAR